MAEASNAGSEGASHIGIDKSHLSGFIIVFVVHVVDEVQGIDVNADEPIHHLVVFGDDRIVIEVFGGNRGISWADLLTGFHVDSAIDRVKQALGKVGARSEELHLFASLGGGNAAADRIVITPHWAHHIVILVLDGRGIDGDFRGVVLEILRKSLGIENREVWLWGWAHVLESMEETEVIFRD